MYSSPNSMLLSGLSTKLLPYSEEVVLAASLSTEIRLVLVIVLPFLVQEVRTVTLVSTCGTSSTTQVRVNTVPEYSVAEGSTGDTSRPVKVIVGVGTVRGW